MLFLAANVLLLILIMSAVFTRRPAAKCAISACWAILALVNLFWFRHLLMISGGPAWDGDYNAPKLVYGCYAAVAAAGVAVAAFSLRRRAKQKGNEG